MAICRRSFVELLCIVTLLGLIAASCSSDSASVTSEPTTTTEAKTTTTAEPDVHETAEPEERDFSAVTDTIAGYVESEGLEGAGLIVVDGDEGVLYEEYFGTFTADRVSLIASSSKMISAGVLLRLHEDGLLDIDAPIEGVVDWAVGNPDITTAQLLSNSSGLVGLGPNVLYAPYLCQWGVTSSLQECGATVFSGTNDDADQVPPDTEFRYGGAQWQVAGAVAEAVSGKSWDELIDEIYVGPCGVDSLGYINLGAVVTGSSGYPVSFDGEPEIVTPSANPTVEGGAFINVGDYGKLLLMHLRGGLCGENRVLSQQSIDTMHTDRISGEYGGDAGDENTGYGMGWWVDRRTGRISDGGAWGALPWLDLDDGYGAFIIVEDRSSTGQALKRLIEELVHTAVTGT